MNTLKISQIISFEDLENIQTNNLKENETIVFFTSYKTKFKDSLLNKYQSFLTHEFVQKTNRFKRWEDQNNALFGKLLVYAGYYYLTGQKIDFLNYKTNLNGKPFIEGSNLEFNISHTQKTVVCAFNLEKIGIDIEQIQNIEYKNFITIFSDEEMQKINKNDIYKFYEFWTKKESLSKAIGKGLTLPLKEINVLTDTINYKKSVFKYYNFIWNDIYCTIAIKSKIKNKINWIEIKF